MHLDIINVYTALIQCFEVSNMSTERWIENDKLVLKFHRDNVSIAPFLDQIAYYLSKYTNVVWDVGTTCEVENKKTYTIIRPRSNAIPNVKVEIYRVQDTGMKRVHHKFFISIE